MAWVRIDTSLVRHPKILALTPQERWHHLCAMAWTAENHTDGLIPRAALPVVVPVGRRGLAVVAKFVAVGLWEELDVDSWLIHDWLEYNISGERSKELKQQRAERQRKWREKRQDATSNNASHDASNNASHDASRSTSLARRRPRVRPDPTRPDPSSKEEGRGRRSAPSSSPGATSRTANDEEDDMAKSRHETVSDDGLLQWEADDLARYRNTNETAFLNEILVDGTPAARRRVQEILDGRERHRLRVLNGGAE